ncbi:hypothetical protein DFH09DRAFT_1076326 [Mycena vulgaris]|nr:hypothetical protein DFH09DRAFT_1076326 [Mycena vulgaris]
MALPPTHDSPEFMPGMPGIPHFQRGTAEWNHAWEAQFPALSPRIGNLDSTFRPYLQDAERISYNGVPVRPDVKDSHKREGMRRLFVLQNELKVLTATVVLRPDFR